MDQLPFSQACENNKEPILQVLKVAFKKASRILEIGSGTGQHAVHFAANLPNVEWLTSDLPENHPGILGWQSIYDGANLQPPLALNVAQPHWPDIHVDGVFTANTLHIMSWEEDLHFFARLPDVLKPGGCLVVYGPFNYNGNFTSESNREFDAWLKEQVPHRGIRDFEAVCAQLEAVGLSLQNDIAMPANNRCLVFERQ